MKDRTNKNYIFIQQKEEFQLSEESWLELNTYLKNELLKPNSGNCFTGKFDEKTRYQISNLTENLIKKNALYSMVYAVHNYINADLTRILATTA